jgi:hypothetical protein
LVGGKGCPSGDAHAASGPPSATPRHKTSAKKNDTLNRNIAFALLVVSLSHVRAKSA